MRERALLSSVSIIGFVRGSPGVLIYCVLVDGLFINPHSAFLVTVLVIRIMTTL